MIHGNALELQEIENRLISSIHVKLSCDIFIHILQRGIKNILMKLTARLGNDAATTEKLHKVKWGHETEKICSENYRSKQIGI